MRNDNEIKRYTGTYVDVANNVQTEFGMGMPDAYALAEDLEHNKNQLMVDLPRVAIIGNEEVSATFQRLWSDVNDGTYFQGNMHCPFPPTMLTNKYYKEFDQAQKKTGEEITPPLCINAFFGYLDFEGKPAGLALVVKTVPLPQTWMLGINRNSTGVPHDRREYLYSSPNLRLHPFRTGISWQKMQLSLVDEIANDAIASIITNLIEEDGNINIILFNLLCTSLAPVSFVEPQTILQAMESSTLAVLNGKAIEGCELFLLHSSRSAQKPIKRLRDKLMQNTDDTVKILSNYFNNTADIDWQHSSTSCLLTCIFKNKLLRTELALTQESLAALQNSKTVRADCLAQIISNLHVLDDYTDDDSPQMAKF
ncbi:MAG: hypothetical protein M3R00_04575 [Pseudomonadota bacterium]|nr:hypothetical protein [Pseudomonadota bacterium]